MAITGAASESGAAAFISNSTPTTLVTNGQGANLSLRLDKLLITNIDTSTAYHVQIYEVPSGGSISGDDYKILKEFDIKPSDGVFGTEDIREVAGMILENGDSLRALAETASKLKFHLSYWKES